MDSIETMDGWTDARQQLVQIWADPQVRRFARGNARDPQLADDALQSTYCAMARLKNPDEIKNLKAYFYRVLVQQVSKERTQLGAALIDDFAFVADLRGTVAGSGPALSAEFEDAACFSVQAWSWHKRLTNERDELMAKVPARSDKPSRYRAVIYAAVEQILLAGIDGEPSEADKNDALLVSYPEYFDQPGTSRDTCHQRFCRARVDVDALLRAVAGDRSSRLRAYPLVSASLPGMSPQS